MPSEDSELRIRNGSNVGLKMAPSEYPSSLSPCVNRAGDFFVLDCVGVPICLGLDDQIQKLGFVNLNQYHALMVMRLLYHIVGYTMRRCVFYLNWLQYTREGDQGVCV